MRAFEKREPTPTAAVLATLLTFLILAAVVVMAWGMYEGVRSFLPGGGAP